MRIFGIDPGSERTGYGCVETDGHRHRLVSCGAITASRGEGFPERLARIHHELTALLAACRPQCVAVESLFHAANVRSALKLGHARGVAILAAVEAGCEVVEYSPAEVKRAVVGYGRAEKHQVQQMIKLLLGLRQAPTPYDAADALAVAICHLNFGLSGGLKVRTVLSGMQATRDAARRTDSPGPDGRTGGRRLRAEADVQGRQKSARSWRHYRPPTG